MLKKTNIIRLIWIITKKKNALADRWRSVRWPASSVALIGQFPVVCMCACRLDVQQLHGCATENVARSHLSIKVSVQPHTSCRAAASSCIATSQPVRPTTVSVGELILGAVAPFYTGVPDDGHNHVWSNRKRNQGGNLKSLDAWTGFFFFRLFSHK